MLQHAVNTMNTGKVKFFDKAKGFGFIKANNGQDVFVHSSGLNEDIKEDDEVKFEIEDGKKGPSAVKVSVV